MTSFSELIQQSAAHAWLFVPSAILLGALHGLEPGHSKTMMAAFIVAIRGTVGQAVLLGLAATVSHTFVVWAIALGGMYLWRGIDAERAEPYLQIASAAIMIGIALWMFLRTWRHRVSAADTGHRHDHADHGHDHGHGHGHGHDAMDDHERAHAVDIRRRFSGRPATNGQILLFGLTGGLVPCPAAITVLLLCLQLKEIPLGAVLVLCFSIGLALTLVAVGAIAAIGAGHVSTRLPWLAALAGRAPYASSLLIVAVGLYVGIGGWVGLAALSARAGG